MDITHVRGGGGVQRSINSRWTGTAFARTELIRRGDKRRPACNYSSVDRCNGHLTIYPITAVNGRWSESCALFLRLVQPNRLIALAKILTYLSKCPILHIPSKCVRESFDILRFKPQLSPLKLIFLKYFFNNY